jgi:hypothetical protein
MRQLRRGRASARRLLGLRLLQGPAGFQAENKEEKD